MSKSLRAEDLVQLMLHADLDRLAEALAPLDEGDRAELEDTVWLFWHQLFESPMDPQLLEIRRTVPEDHWERILEAGRLGLVAVARRSRLRDLRLWSLEGPTEDCFVRILDDRRPPWLQKWFEENYRRGLPEVEWRIGRRMVIAGMVERPTSDGWILSMVRARANRTMEENPSESLYQRLLDMPDIFEHEFWRLFEVPSDNTNWYPDLYQEERGDTGELRHWGPAVVRLAATGHVDRDRLIDALLSALVSDLPSRQLAAFVRLHDDLEPSLEETLARQSAYARLLEPKIPQVIALGHRRLGTFADAGQLDLEALARASHAVFGRKTKTQAMATLELLDRGLAQEAGDADRAIEAATEAAIEALRKALEHPTSDIRERAAEILEERLGIGTADDRDEPADPSITPEEQQEWQALRQRLDALDAEALGKVGLDPALVAADGPPEHLPPPLELAWPDPVLLGPVPGTVPTTGDDVDDVDDLAGYLGPLEPIADPAELLRALEQATHDLSTGAEVERLIDAISRFADRRPAEDPSIENGREIVDALMGRIRYVVSYNTFFSHAFHDLVTTWLEGEARPEPAYYRGPEPDPGADAFSTLRLREIERRVIAGQPAPLLATPTHGRGWIEPRVLVERLAERLAPNRAAPNRAAPNRAAPGRADLLQALLRLAPGGRAEALDALRALRRDREPESPWPVILDALAFALGADLPESPAGDPVLWLTAARARDPRGDFPELGEKLGAGKKRAGADGPDGLKRVRWSWISTLRSDYENRGYGPQPTIDLERQPMPSSESGTGSVLAAFAQEVAGEKKAGPKTPSLDFLHPHGPRIEAPAVALHRTPTPHRYRFPHAWSVDWALGLWPASPDAVWAAGLPYVLARRDDTSHSVIHAYVRPLADPDQPWTEPGLLILWNALLCREVGARESAVRVMRAAIADGRGHAGSLGHSLVRLAEGDWIEPNRLADALQQVAETSPLHALVAAQLLAAWVGTWPYSEEGKVKKRIKARPPRSAHRVLEAWLDLALDLGLDVIPGSAAHRILGGVKGRTKVAILARKLMALEPRPNARRRQAVRQAIAIRLARAERGRAEDERAE